jgi:hypothetical protein
MTKRWLAMVAVLAVAGCAAPSDPVSRDVRLPDEMLYVTTSAGVAAVGVRSGDISESTGDSVFAAGFSHIFQTSPDPRGTSLRELDPDSLYELDELSVDGRFVARAASARGTLVALMPPRSDGDGPYVPEGRSSTELVVADTSSGDMRSYELDGNFEPEAFSTDDRFLYMIEYIPPNDPDRYRVRTLRIDNGALAPIGRLKGAPPQMRGTGRTQVMAPDGNVLYTLYTRQGPNNVHASPRVPDDGPHVYSFVHMLNLAEGWAHCIDLPRPFGTGDATVSAITTTPSGSQLFIADPSTNALASVDRDELGVVQRADLGLEGRSLTAAVATTNPAGDVLYVAVGETLRSYDAATLDIRDVWDLPGVVTALRTSFDGSFVYAGIGDEVIVVDAADGSDLTRIEVPGIEDIVHVGAPG